MIYVLYNYYYAINESNSEIDTDINRKILRYNYYIHNYHYTINNIEQSNWYKRI